MSSSFTIRGSCGKGGGFAVRKRMFCGLVLFREVTTVRVAPARAVVGSYEKLDGEQVVPEGIGGGDHG